MPALHEKLPGAVTYVNEWGFLVHLSNGEEGFVDKTKSLAWHGEGPERHVGDKIVVVVLDDERTPRRLSELPDDIAMARRLDALVARVEMKVPAANTIARWLRL